MSDEKLTPAIIWDMDGVLIDSGDLHYYTWRDALDEELGFQLDRGWFDAMFGHDNDSFLEMLFGEERSAGLYRRLGEAKEAAFRRDMHLHVRPIEASVALVEALHRLGWPQIVATSAPRGNVLAMMEVLGFNRWFDAYVCIDDVASGKPAPDVFLRAAERLGVPPGGCVVIEDSIPGISAARAAGMACLALTTTRPAEQLGMADRVVESLAGVTPDDLIALANGTGQVEVG